ncbi:MAG: hypothetical protein HC835_11985 [Oscillatoriales cyanobacterium RM2_1_1]|nr:hypothetical protein [Oscillatoriales cyanobacterium SM2_3_0]NJO46285.1 hypothetical protein [Oscillatoriales cyanobacterium RM2_1_1]
MSELFWRPSDEQRQTILLMEVAGLLHDLGKMSNGFIKKSAQDTPTGFSYDYELIADPNIVFPPIAKSVSQRVNDMQKKQLTLTDIHYSNTALT